MTRTTRWAAVLLLGAAAALPAFAVVQQNQRTADSVQFRAAELTLQNGYDVFTIVNRDTDKDSTIRRTGGYYGPRFSYMYFSPRWGWVGAWDPFWTSSPSRYDEVTRYEAYAEIVMTKGPKGSDVNAFDAREVSQNLASTIQRPSS